MTELYIDEVVAQIQKIEANLQAVEASKRVALSIQSLAKLSQHWEPLENMLREKRQLAMERMASANADDRTRGDLAAEIRVLHWLAECPAAAARQIPQMDKQIGMYRQQIEEMSRRVPQTGPQ